MRITTERGEPTGSQPPDISTGNALDPHLRQAHGGWFIGSFVTEGGLQRSDDIEVKWGEHERGEARLQPALSATATSLTVLVRGLFELHFPALGFIVVLDGPGDFATYGPGVLHRWVAVDASTVFTVRWPSGSP